MKKKIILCSTLLIVTLISLMISSVFDFNSSHSTLSPEEEGVLQMEDWPEEFATIDSIPGGLRASFKPTFQFDCSVRAHNFPQDKVILSRSNKYLGQSSEDVFRVEMQKVKLSIPMEKANYSAAPYIIGFGWITALLLYVWMLVIIIKLIKSIRRGEVFVSKVSESMRKIGSLLAVIYVFDSLFGYIIYRYLTSNVHIAQYDIVYSSSANPMFLVMGLVLLILSQIILMGKELKEEQELTI